MTVFTNHSAPIALDPGIHIEPFGSTVQKYTASQIYRHGYVDEYGTQSRRINTDSFF